MNQFEQTKLKHIAIIMDGNGRWAQTRSHNRVWGHVRGSKVVSNIVEKADEMGVKALTLYAFSTENWSRPLNEVSVLFKLLKKFLMKERDRILRNQIRFKVVGDISQLPAETIELIKDLESATKEMYGLKLTFAFGYGSRREIVNSVNKFIAMNPGANITEEDIERNLSIPESGDIDLLIRTGGDNRVSNFFLWQIAYSELYFTLTKWQDFTAKEFSKILKEVSLRERRFGQVSSTSDLCVSKQEAIKNKSIIQQTISRH